MLSTAGIVPTCPSFDVPSLFTRDIATLHTISQSWFNGSHQTRDSSKPWKLLFPLDYLPVDNQEQMRSINTFADALATWLSTDVEKISIAGTWRAHPPAEANGMELNDYLFDVIPSYPSNFAFLLTTTRYKRMASSTTCTTVLISSEKITALHVPKIPTSQILFAGFGKSSVLSPM